jgi:DNA polymerase-1
MNKKYIEDILQAIAGKDIGLDTETTGLDPLTDSLTAISIYTEAKEGFYIPLGSSDFPYLETLKLLKPLGTLPKRVFIHNAKFDLKFFKVAGIEFTCPVGCSYIGHLMLDDSKSGHSLDAISRSFLGEGKESSYDQVGSLFGPSMETYAKKDAELHYRVMIEVILPWLEKENQTKVFWEMEMPVLMALVETELRGVDIDLDYLYILKDNTKKRIKLVESEIYKIAGRIFNINSNEEISRILYDELKLTSEFKVPTKKPGIYVTDANALEAIKDKHPLPKLIIDYRGIYKLLTTYIESYIEEHVTEQLKVHANFNQVGAKARFSSDDPNLQNLEAVEDGIRAAVTGGPDGVIIQSDYAQVELRLGCIVANERTMIDALKEGRDLHSESAKAWGLTRSQAKSANFGFIFGMSAQKFSNEYNIDLQTSIELRVKFMERYKAFKEYYNKVHEDLRKREFVTTIFGRRRFFRGYKNEAYSCYQCKSSGQERLYPVSFEGRKCTKCGSRLTINWNGSAVNYKIQGSAADLLKVAYRNLYREILIKRNKFPNTGWEDVYVICLIHDEMLTKSPNHLATEVLKLVKDTMESAVKLEIPILAEAQIIHDYGEAKVKTQFRRIRRNLRRKINKDKMKVLLHNFDSNKVERFINKIYG